MQLLLRHISYCMYIAIYYISYCICSYKIHMLSSELINWTCVNLLVTWSRVNRRVPASRFQGRTTHCLVGCRRRSPSSGIRRHTGDRNPATTSKKISIDYSLLTSTFRQLLVFFSRNCTTRLSSTSARHTIWRAELSHLIQFMNKKPIVGETLK